MVWRGSGWDGMSLFPLVSTRGVRRVVSAVTSEKAVDEGQNEVNVGTKYLYRAGPPHKKSKIRSRINS